MPYILNGVVIGLMVAAPLGPVGLLCVRRTLAHGRTSGQLSGFGAATAHGIYGLIAGLGLTSVSGFLIRSQVLLALMGALFLCYLGIKTFRATPCSDYAPPGSGGRLHNYLSTLALAIANPLTILSFLGIFAGVGMQRGTAQLLLVLGIFLGSVYLVACLNFFCESIPSAYTL